MEIRRIQTDSIMYCKHCGSQIGSNASVCVNCGVRNGDGNRFCPNCGYEHDPAAAVCVKCGIPLNAEKSENVNSLGGAIQSCFKKYVTFTGRANRSEYWYWALFTVLFSFIPFINFVASIAFFLPSLAVAVRRLHDIGKSGWWYLIVFIPFIGWIWLLILFCTPSDPNTNEYGTNPNL